MIQNNKFPLHLPGLKSENNNQKNILAVDLRRDKTNISLYRTENQAIIVQNEKEYATGDYSNFSSMVNQFIQEYGLENIDRLSVAVPGPVIRNKVKSDRLDWELDRDEISKETNIEWVDLVNDLEAYAYGLVELSEDRIISIHEPDKKAMGNMAILAPGNGLGEAGLFYDGDCLRPFATEGGHSEFSPRTEVEVEFYQFLNKIYGIVSWESVLSKEGIFNIFRFLRDEKRHPQSEKFVARLKEVDFVTALYEAAVEDQERIATITINTYLEFLAREANNLALKLKATGGLIIGGELPVLLQDYIDNEVFYRKFMISDKMEKVLKSTPLYLISSDKMTMNGVAYYSAFSKM